MDKMQAEEIRDISSQKVNYEEKSAMLQAIYPSADPVKSTKKFCKKWNFFQDLSRPCANNDF